MNTVAVFGSGHVVEAVVDVAAFLSALAQTWLVLLSSSGQKSFIFQAKVRLLLGLKLFGNRAEKEMKLPCKNTALTLPSPLSFHRL